MKYQGTKRHAGDDDGGLKPRKQRKAIPANFEDDDVDDACDVMDQEVDESSLTGNDT
jgi:hypothetical protein